MGDYREQLTDENVIFLVDGENMVCRFQAMLGGDAPSEEVIHQDDRYVWSSSLNRVLPARTWKVVYYTTVVGSDEVVREVEKSIGNFSYSPTFWPSPSTGSLVPLSGTVIPRVYKKRKGSQKSRIVDVHLVIDALRFASQPHVDTVAIVSGDGDFVALAEEIMKRGKRLWVLAFSSGLDERLREVADRFVDLDPLFGVSARGK